jgi:hypothetical protein
MDQAMLAMAGSSLEPALVQDAYANLHSERSSWEIFPRGKGIIAMSDVWPGPVTVMPIGVVECDFKEFSQRTTNQMESVILIREELTKALLGIEHFSHIHVLYQEHRRAE